jgi:quercetin dioxygenase-like cupin family protein
MEVYRPEVSFSDMRGEIIDLLEGEEINAVTIVTFRAGAVRGNHYHRETTQWNYVLAGRISVACVLPSGDRSDVVLDPGHLIVIGPDEQHAFIALEEATMAVFTKGPRGGKEYETDTYRLETPLIAPGTPR